MAHVPLQDNTLTESDIFSATLGGDMLWQELKKRSLRYKFRPQFSIGVFCVDLYCHELKLVVEILDDSNREENKEKETWLLSHGCTIVHFTETQVLHDQEKVIEKIFYICLHLTSLI